MSLESQIQEAVARMECVAVPTVAAAADAEPVGAIGDRLREIIDALTEGLANVDEAEAAAILANVEQALAAYVSGNWVMGLLLTAQAMKLLRQATRN